MALVDGVGDDNAVVVPGQFQPESGFGLFGLLLWRHFGFPFHTTEEQKFFGVNRAGCDENVTKRLRQEAQSP